MSNTPSDADIVALAISEGIKLRTGAGVVRLARAVLAKWGTQPQAGAVPQGWKAVPVNPTPEMWKAAKTVPDPNPPYPPHYGLVWDAMLAASPTPTAEQQAVPKAAPGAPTVQGLQHQLKLLAEALGACILASGIVRKDIDGFDGPQLLLFAEDLRSMLEATPQPAPAPLSEKDLRTRFEALARDSYNFKRSRRDCYVNPATARDWKWFRLGANVTK